MITDRNLGVSLNPISLGGTYASDAAANADYVTRAARAGQSQTVPAGCIYYNSTTNRPRFYNGTSWDEFVPGGPAGAGTLDDVENNGRTITLASGAIALNDSTAGAGLMLQFNKSGAGSGNLLEFNVSAAATGHIFRVVTSAAWNANVFNIDLTSSNAASRVLNIPNDGVNHSGTGWVAQIANAGTGAGNWIDVRVNGAGSGNIINVVSSAAHTGDFLHFDQTSATGARLINLDLAANTVSVIRVAATTGSGDILAFSASGAYTGNVLAPDLTNAVGGRALNVTAAGARTASWFNITDSSTANVPGILYTLTGLVTDSLQTFDINANANVPITRYLLASQVAGSGAILIDEEAAAKAGYDIRIAKSGTGSARGIDIPVSGAGSGDVINITTSAAYSGNAISVTLTTSAATAVAYAFDGGAARAWSVAQHSYTSGSGAFTSNLMAWVVNGAGTGASNLLAVTASAAFAGDVFDINMTSMANGARCLVLDTGSRAFSSSPIVITGSGAVTPTADLLRISCAWTGGTNNLIGVVFTGTWGAGDVLNITMAGSAAGAQAIVAPSSVAFTNPLVELSGSAAHTAALLSLSTSSAAGAANVAALANLNYTGAAGLVDTADCVRIASVMSHAADSHVLAVEQSTAAGTVGAHCLYISATGANVEGIRVDDGIVTVDERIVLGTTTNGVRIIGDSGTAGVEYLGSRRPQKDIWVRAEDMIAGSVGAAVTANIANTQTWVMREAASDSVRFNVAMPYDFASTTAAYVELYVSDTAGGAGNTVWRIDFRSAAVTDVLTGALTAGTATAGLAAPAANALAVYGHASDTLAPAGVVTNANLTIAGATLSAGRLLIVEVVRLPADAADTYVSDMNLVAVRLVFTAAAA